jgi:CRISPR-associated protein Cmr4
MSVRPLFIHALSPLHAGTGQSTGAIELAIARDRATGFPCLPGSSIKGALRDRALDRERPDTSALFGPGPDSGKASDHAGALAFGDANLLLLPVRSIAGTFAWVTSPYLLARFARDVAEAGITGLPSTTMPSKVGDCIVAPGSSLVIQKKDVIFEDLNLDATAHEPVKTLADFLGGHLFGADAVWRTNLVKRLCVVHDDVMSFLSTHATDVVARVALKHESKTVENLWHEESLPTETVLVSLVAAAPNAKTGMDREKLFKALAELTDKTIQLGGKATVGRGRCRVVLGNGGRR